MSINWIEVNVYVYLQHHYNKYTDIHPHIYLITEIIIIELDNGLMIVIYLFNRCQAYIYYSREMENTTKFEEEKSSNKTTTKKWKIKIKKCDCQLLSSVSLSQTACLFRLSCVLFRLCCCCCMLKLTINESKQQKRFFCSVEKK